MGESKSYSILEFPNMEIIFKSKKEVIKKGDENGCENDEDKSKGSKGL